MNGHYDLPICLFWFPAFMIGLGLINIFKKDWAWWIAQSMLRHVQPQRTPEWEKTITINGVILIAGGSIVLLYMLSMLS